MNMGYTTWGVSGYGINIDGDIFDIDKILKKDHLI